MWIVAWCILERWQWPQILLALSRCPFWGAARKQAGQCHDNHHDAKATNGDYPLQPTNEGLADLGIVHVKQVSGVHLRMVPLFQGSMHVLLGRLTKDTLIVGNHLLNAFLGSHAEHFVRIPKEVHSKVEGDGA